VPYRSRSGTLERVGVNVVLKLESGKEVRGLADPAGGTFDAARDFDRLLSATDESIRMLKDVDPYGDTVFNALQMPALLTDLDRLTALDLAPIERRGLDRLRVMAERCRDEVHLYIWFIGD
jgi:hypothetical protein